MAGVIVWTIMLVVFGLAMFYYLLEFINKRQQKKIREGYDKDEDKSRNGDIAGNTGRCREAVDSSESGERDTEADVNSSSTSIDEPDTTDDIGEDDKE